MVSSVAGVADPGCGAERLSERIFWQGIGFAGFESMRSYRPTTTSAFPGGGADSGRGAERFSERFFWDSNQCVRICRLKDVAWGPSVETGANVPSYSGGFAAAWWFRIGCLKDVAEGPWFLL